MNLKDLKYEELLEFDNHQLVKYINDSKTGLKGFIAIHNNNLGIAVGGTRMFPYQSEKEALIDVLLLSKAMTYKCALAGVKYGGGKAVIIGDPHKDKNDNLIKAYAREIGALHGEFYTGEDVGISESDVQLMLTESAYFIGKTGLAGDPSSYASLSTFYSIQVACGQVFGTENLSGLKIGIKGVGKVGGELVRLLVEAGADVTIADVNELAVKRITDKYPEVKVGNADEIHLLQMDVYSPCALGHEFTLENMKDIKAKIICGGANNQIATKEVGKWLHEHDILYVPDYVSNSGGLINVVDELEPGGYNNERVLARIKNIKNTVKNIITLSNEKNLPTCVIADELAEGIFNHAKKEIINTTA